MSIKLSKPLILAILFFILIALSWSPALAYILKINNKLIFAISFIAIVLISTYKQKINITIYLYTLLFIAISILFSIISENYTLWLSLLGIPLSFFIIENLLKYNYYPTMDILTKYLSAFTIIGIIFSFIAVIYHYLGGEAIYQIKNPDGRYSYLYISSFSNAGFGNIIRPSFIYDEPGAFSFFICFVVCLRSLLKKNIIITTLIMTLGLITFSLTHLILLILFLLCNFKLKYKYIFMFSIILFLFVFISDNNELKPFIDRLDSLSSGENNRTSQINNFINNVNLDKVLFAGEVDCQNSSIYNYCSKKYGDMSSSPLSVIFYNGILGALVQLVISFTFIYFSFKKRILIFPSLCMLILTIQRPYFFATGYSTMILITLFLMVYQQMIQAQLHERKS